MEKLDDWTEDQKVIPLSKSTLLLVFGIDVLFVVLGLWLIVVHPTRDMHPIFKHPNAIVAVGCVTILFFGFFACYSLFNLLGNKPALIVSKTGLIVNNCSPVARGKILWSDVYDITVFESVKRHHWDSKELKWVCLHVRNPEEYISRQKNISRQRWMRRSLEACGTPIAITSYGLSVSFDELLEVLNEYYAKSQL